MAKWFQDVRQQDDASSGAGDGASAATASHFACDTVRGPSPARQSRFRILALTEKPTLTTYSNDVGYDAVFVEQLGKHSGVLYMAIGGSGNFSNALRAMEFAIRGAVAP